MEITDLPHLVIKTINSNDVSGHFRSSSWIGEGWIGCLYIGHGRFIWGRFRQVDFTTENLVFDPDTKTDLSSLKIDDSYPYLDGYWGERAELVLDESRHWEKRRFEPTDSVGYPVNEGGWLVTKASPSAPPGGEIVPGGWDHEHCDICWEKISQFTHAEGYYSSPDTWICELCHTRYVVPRSLGFICQNVQ